MKSRWKGDTQVVANEPQKYHNPNEFSGNAEKRIDSTCKKLLWFQGLEKSAA